MVEPRFSRTCSTCSSEHEVELATGGPCPGCLFELALTSAESDEPAEAEPAAEGETEHARSRAARVFDAALSRTVSTRLLPVLALAWALHGPAPAEPIRVAGRVMLPAGAPAAGLTIELVAEPGRYESGRLMLAGRWRPEPTETALTDAEGRFVLEAPAPGMWRLRLEAGGFRPMECQLFPLVGPTLAPPLELTPELTAEVRILAADGRIASGGRVRAEGPKDDERSTEPAAWQPAWRQAFTDERGVARLGRGVEETLEVYAWAPGHLEARLGGVIDTTVRLEPSVPFAVTVTDHLDRALADVEVRLGERRWPIGRTDEAGGIEVPLAARGEQTLEFVLADGRRLYRDYDPATWPRGEPYTIALPPPATLSGRLLDAETGRPLAGGFLWRAGRPGDHVASDASGRFSLAPDLAGVELWIWAAAAGHVTDAVLWPSPEQGETTLRLHPEASAAGIVVDATGRPVGGAELAADVDLERSRGPAAQHARRQLERASSADDGTFVLGSLHPEVSYVLRASKPGFATVELLIPDPRSAAARDLRVELETGRLVTGTVVGPDRAPIAGARVELSEGVLSGSMLRLLRSSPAGLEHRVSTDATGRFAIRDLAPGAYTLRAAAAGYAPALVPAAEVSADSAATDLGEVLLERGMIIEGRVTGERGAPLSGARILASPSNRHHLMRPQVDEDREASSDADGHFAIRDLPEGARLDLWAEAPGYARGQVDGVEAPTAALILIELGPASRVSGRVEDAAGRPVARAQVIMVSTSRRSRSESTTSDESGEFVLEEVDPGELELRTEAEGFVSHVLANLVVEPGSHLEGVTITLERGASILGRVTDASGGPVAEASVTVWTELRLGRPSAVHGRSDGDGRYRLDGVPQGAHQLEAQHEDFAEVSRQVEVESGENHVDIAFEESTTVAGRVLDESGEPIVGARVQRLTTQPGGHLSGGSGSPAVSDSAGRFILKGVAPGSYELRAEAEGFGPGGVEDLEVGRSGLEGVEIRLTAGSLIVGRLYGLERTDYQDVRILARREDGVGYSSFVGIVGPEGDYRIDDVSPGTYRVDAEVADSGLDARGTVEVLPGLPRAVLDLRFEAGITVSGLVLAAGEPFADALVRVESLGGDGARGATTDGSGRFELGGLEPGSARLHVTGADIDHQEQVEIADGAYFVVRLLVVTVSGVVRDGADFSPLVGAEVRIEPEDRDVSSFMRSYSRPSVTDSTGSFRLARVPAGSYRMLVSHEGYAPSERWIEVTSGLDLEDIEVLLTLTEGIRVKVILPGGQPADFFSAAAVDASGRVAMVGDYRSGESGARLDVPPGQWELLISVWGAALSSTRITVPSDPILISLEEGANLVVSVPELQSEPAEATARFVGSSGRPVRFLTGMTLHDEWPMRAGQAMVPSLPTGACVVTVEASDGRVWQGTATLVPGDNPELVLP